jgi:hypothetical protein
MSEDLPPGPWSELLVGHHWPAASSLALLRAAVTQRDAVAAAHDGYADTLASIANSTLAPQSGVTADSIRARFDAGQNHARSVAERNRVKQQSYRSALAIIESLRSDLAGIAAAGNSAIENIRVSQAPAPAKTAAITDVISGAHADADARAALHAGAVYAAVQSIVDAEGFAASARAFAALHGLAFTGAAAPDSETIAGRVAAAVAEA